MLTKRKIFIILIPIVLVFTLGFGFTTTAKAVEFDEDGYKNHQGMHKKSPWASPPVQNIEFLAQL